MPTYKERFGKSGKVKLGPFTLPYLTLLFVRGPFGLAFGIAFGVALVTASKHLSATLNRGLLLTLGLTSALYAILDIKSDVIDRPQLESDAHMLADLTGVPTAVWGVLWIAVAIGVSARLLRRAYREA